MNKSIILNTDSYKVSMNRQLPPNTTKVYSYIESRGGQYNQTVFFGLQAFIKEYLLKPFSQSDIDFAEIILTAHGEPFNRAGWEYILKEHNGYLPLVIKAIPEGTVVPVKNVLATVENTDPNCAWLTTYCETALLRAIWYPTTVATRSWHVKQIILKYLEETGDPSLISYKFHDFGARGVSSFESAGLGGAAHLVNFLGTDTITGLLFANEYYSGGIAGFSIPASEHSVIVAWGKDKETDAYRNMLEQFGRPGSMFACVSDSYSIYNAVENIWGTELKDEVINSGATLVIRPDSGDPVEVCSELVQILDKKFGSTVNDKGYKVLNPAVRLIQGDGVNETAIQNILQSFKSMGYSADNIAFGCGGYLLQQVDRDTQRFAMKASAVCIDGKWNAVSKDPVTDPTKKSKAGRVTLYQGRNKQFYSGVEDWETPALLEVYRNGKLLIDYQFSQVRKNSEVSNS